jgi:peptidoglycan/xylan/chitin deacetylase (PgdA/CDA1 family)
MTLSPVGGERGVVSLTFDNLGEAAELELGTLGADAPLGGHATATEVVPALLERLAAHGVPATFFVEGLNAELYPDLLREIDSRGHEVAFHAWRHEQWGDLTAVEQAENLARGVAAFGHLGLRIAGMRPPGGQLGPGGVAVLREAGLSYCSPAGSGAVVDAGIALLPFAWCHVDASCVLPPLSAAREQMSGSPDPVEAAAFVAWLGEEIDALARTGGFLAIVLHPFMLAWLGEDNLEALLEHIATAGESDELWVARCVDAADHVLATPQRYRGATLDTTSWSG